MNPITLEPKLMHQLEQVAAEQTTSADELLEVAVRTYLRQLEREKIRKEAAIYRTLHPQLCIDYLGQYVAIHHGRVVDNDPDFAALHTRVRLRFGQQAILIRQVESEPARELTFRSPRIEREETE